MQNISNMLYMVYYQLIIYIINHIKLINYQVIDICVDFKYMYMYIILPGIDQCVPLFCMTWYQ